MRNEHNNSIYFTSQPHRRRRRRRPCCRVCARYCSCSPSVRYSASGPESNSTRAYVPISGVWRGRRGGNSVTPRLSAHSLTLGPSRAYSHLSRNKQSDKTHTFTHRPTPRRLQLRLHFIQTFHNNHPPFHFMISTRKSSLSTPPLGCTSVLPHAHHA